MRDKIFGGKLCVEECTDQDVHEFLKLLKNENNNRRDKFIQITIEE